MAELTTLARPYARAAFEAALAHNQLAEWSAMLNLAATVCADPAMARVIKHPSLTTEQKVAAVVDVGGDQLSEAARNFIRVMADNNRLALLPYVAERFEDLKHQHEQSIEVELTTPFDISDEQQDKLAKALEKKLSRKIQLSTVQDKSLIGGVVIRADDMVIDASVRAKLAKLAEAMSS